MPQPPQPSQLPPGLSVPPSCRHSIRAGCPLPAQGLAPWAELWVLPGGCWRCGELQGRGGRGSGAQPMRQASLPDLPAAPGADPVSVLQQGRAAETALCPPPGEAEVLSQSFPAGEALPEPRGVGGALQPPGAGPGCCRAPCLEGNAVSAAINLPAAVALSPGADAASSPCTALPSLRQQSLVQAARSGLGLESAEFSAGAIGPRAAARRPGRACSSLCAEGRCQRRGWPPVVPRKPTPGWPQHPGGPEGLQGEPCAASPVQDGVER